MSFRRALPGAMAAAMVATILFVTLQAVPASPGSAATLVRSCLICGTRGSADAILNVLLFMPLGAALAWGGVRIRHVVAAILTLSAGIEVAQLGLVGRFATLGDVVWNTTGGAAGALLVTHRHALLGWYRRRPGVTGFLLVLMPVVVWLGSAWALVPSPQRGVYYGQWTAALGPSLGTYRGEILDATIGEQPAPSWILGDSDAARTALLEGAPLSIRFVAGAPPERLSPIFSIYDGTQREVLLVGADGPDLVLRIRRRAADVRLDQPHIRWRQGLAGLGAGDTTTLAIRRAGASTFCMTMDGHEQCGGPGPLRGWALLMSPDSAPPPLLRAMDVLWGLMGMAMVVSGVLRVRTRLVAGPVP